MAILVGHINTARVQFLQVALLVGAVFMFNQPEVVLYLVLNLPRYWAQSTLAV